MVYLLPTFLPLVVISHQHGAVTIFLPFLTFSGQRYIIHIYLSREDTEEGTSTKIVGLVAKMILFLFLFSKFFITLAAAGGCSDYRQDADLSSVGMHILCAIPSTNGITVTGLLNAVLDIGFNFTKDRGDIFPLLQEMFRLYGTTNNRKPTKWVAFTTYGSPIYSIDSLLYHRTAIVHTNGHWLWPGVRNGFTQETFDGIRLTTLSVRPLVHRVHNLLTYEECNLIQKLAEPFMKASKTSKMDKDRDYDDTQWRTSTQYFLPSSADSKIETIDYRVASLTKSKLSQQEWVQVLRYEETQQYKHHTDYFDITQYQKDPGVLRMLRGGEQNRLITVFWYLSNVTAGGHTIFPYANRGGGGFSTEDCDIPTALKVQPIKGEAIIFYSLNSDGSIDKKSLHGGCPVIDGTKWSANKWIW